MRTFLTLVATLLLTLGLLAGEAHAKRLGGGTSFGMKSPSYSKSTTSRSTTTTAPTRQTTAAGTSGASRWLGPLAGLAAGGLLAALLFGDAFSGLQPMDLLLLLGAAAMIFFFMKSRRPTPAPAMGGQFRSAAPQPGFEAPEIGGGLRGEPMSAAPAIDGAAATPDWFDRERFLHQAKVHFIRLQAAWDTGDMREIREFTTPELFAELTLEHKSLDEGNFTEVVELEAELVGFIEEAGRFIAGVAYRGLIREARDAEAEPFSEVWHIVRAADRPDADWFVAGIEQQG